MTFGVCRTCARCRTQTRQLTDARRLNLHRWRTSQRWQLSLGVGFLWLVAGSAWAQPQAIVQTPSGPVAVATAGPGAPKGAPNGPPGRPQPGPPGKDAKNADEKGGDASAEKPEDPKVIRRETLDGKEADPEELKVGVGTDGKVAFAFRNQPWVDLIQWLAEISEQPLDWQELPADRVNLASPGRYTVDQTRDLFNRHLLARGYTLLELDGGITVVKTENINPGMVRRVEESDLDSLQPHTFVRTLMDVGWLSSEKLAEELKPMISSNGRLTALTTTNRIEAMDAAINLRQIAELLQQERDVASRDALAPEFRLVHIPAEEAKQMLEEFLGVEKKSSAPMTPQQMQMMQRMQQQNANKAPTAKKETEISIVANTRQNSVLIRGPRDKIATAAEFVRRIDVPSDSFQTLDDIKSRVQAFRLKSLDAEKLIDIVTEMNVLQPKTHIRVDTDNSAVIVSGAAVDRFIVKELIDQLDGSGRRFEVLQLRRLAAEEVAESIAFLMGQEEEDDDDNQSRRYYYYGYGGGGGDDKKEADQFRVAPNARYNQVLLWANENEMNEVRSLLVKLGELPPPGGNRETFRVVEAASTPETYEYLQRLKSQFEQMTGKEIRLPDEENFASPISDPDETSDTDDGTDDENPDGKDQDENDETSGESADDESKSKNSEDDSPDPSEGQPVEPLAQPAASNLTTGVSTVRGQLLVTENEIATNDDGTTEPPLTDTIESMEDFDRQFRDRIRRSVEAQAAKDAEADETPIDIIVDDDGNLVLRSNDTDALDSLEELMLKIRPPQREYVVFHLKHARASMITIDLEDYFATEEEEESDADRFYRYWFYDDSSSSSDKPSGLAAGSRLKFVYNIETNTLVVSGATPSQLRTIRELVELWDVPEPVDDSRARFTKLVKIQYGRAETIAQTLKDAYRDLLSGNDKAFSNKNNAKNGRQGENQERNENGGGGGLTDSQSGQDSGGGGYSFKGKLSFGIDEIGNTLLISAEGKSLLELMEEMVRQLDEAARPGGDVEVLRIGGNLSGQSLQQALEAFGLDGSDREGNDDDNRPANGNVERGPRRGGSGRPFNPAAAQGYLRN